MHHCRVDVHAGAPARPSNVRLYRESDQQALRVQWDAPVRSPHVPVETYSVELLKDDNQYWQYLDTVRPTAQNFCQYEADQLEPGTYVFRVIPFNHVGAGPPAISPAAQLQ